MSHRVAIMQPYLFPYLGYFQLIAAADTFVLYDDAQYMQPGWINRNRILLDGEAHMFSLPVRSAPLATPINQKVFAAEAVREKSRLLKTLSHAYSRAPFHDAAFALIENIVANPETNVARFIGQSVREVCRYLDIPARIVESSALPGNRAHGGQARVIDMVAGLGGDTYVNSIGGLALYESDAFDRQGITLQFLRMGEVRYAQLGAPFVPALSIVDVLMFNSPAEVRGWLTCHTIASKETMLEKAS